MYLRFNDRYVLGVLLSLIVLMMVDSALAGEGGGVSIDVVPYGKFSASRQTREGIQSTSISTEVVEESLYVNHASRLGVKLSAANGSSNRRANSVFSVIEYGMDFDADKRKTFPLRDAYVGIKYHGITTMLGQMNTPTKLAQGDLDLFNDVLDMKSLIAGEYNGDMLLLSGEAGQAKVSVARVVDDDFNEGGLGHGWSASMRWPMEYYAQVDSGYVAVSGDHDINGIDSVRLLAKLTHKQWSVGGLWQVSKSVDLGSDRDHALLLNVSYKLEKLRYKVQFIRSDMDDEVKGFQGIKGDGARFVSLGVEYLIVPSTSLQAYAGFAENHSDQAHALGAGVVFEF